MVTPEASRLFPPATPLHLSSTSFLCTSCNILEMVRSTNFLFANCTTSLNSIRITHCCVPSNFKANWRVPKFSLNYCAQSSKKMFMCPKFCTNPVLKYTKCHISTNLSNFLALCSLYCQKLFALAPTNRRFAEKNRLSGNTAALHRKKFVN